MRYAIIDLLGNQGPTRVDAYEFLRLRPPRGVAGLVPFCPFCMENVKHVRRRIDDVQFFSHYPRAVGTPECDLRVRSISGNSIFRVAGERAETLSYLQNFREILGRYFGELDRNGLPPNRINQLNIICNDMPINWFFEREIQSAFCFESPESIFQVTIMMAPFLVRSIPELQAINLDYLYDDMNRRRTLLIWRCLHIPRERPNLRFLLELTCQFLQQNSIRLSEESSLFREEIIFWSFYLLTIVPWP